MKKKTKAKANSYLVGGARRGAGSGEQASPGDKSGPELESSPQK